MFETYKELIFNKAKEKGFEAYELYYTESKEHSIDFKEGEAYAFQRGAAFRGSVGKQTGTAYLENFSEQGIMYLIDSAYENMLISEPAYTKYYKMGETYNQLEEKDERLEDPNTLYSLARAFQEEIATYKDLGYSKGEVKTVCTTYHIANSYGLNLKHQGNIIYAFFNITVNQSGSMKSTNVYEGGSRLEFIHPKELVKKGRDKCIGYFNTGKIASGQYNILIENDIAALILSALSVFFNGKSAAWGKGIYREKVGRQVAKACVSIVDDPFDLNGVFSMPFDSVGAKAQKQFLIKNGILMGYLNDDYSAECLSEKFACNSHRCAYNITSDVYPTNMRIEEGTISLEKLIKKLDTGVYITDISAYFPGHGVNPITGNFSIPATGFYIKDGEIQYALQGIAIAGNLYDFINNISMIGNDSAYGVPTSFYKGAPKWYGCYSSPTLLVEDITISGEE